MIRSLSFFAGLVGLGVVGAELSTDYTRARALRIETTTRLELETTSFEMLRDGEPVDSPFGGGDMSFELERKLVHVDEVLEHDAGRPTHVRRAFETVAADSSMQFGDQYRDDHHDGPLAGVTLEITLQDGGPVAEVVEGDAPDDETVLEGHALVLALDALLPDGPIDPGASWELESEALIRALGIDLESALFAAPPAEEAPEGEGRGRGRGGRGFGGGTGFLSHTEWEGQASLDEATEDYEGLACQVIALKVEGSGEMPEGEFGAGGGGRGRERSPWRGWTGGLEHLEPLGSALFDNHHEIELEGRLLFCADEGRPVLLELEGTVRTESRTERSRGESTMTMASTREGSFEVRTVITSVAAEAASGEEEDK